MPQPPATRAAAPLCRHRAVSAVVALSLFLLSSATAQSPAPPPGPRFPKSKKSVRLIGCSTATRTSSLQIDRRDPSRIDGFGRIIDLPLKPAIQKAVRADCVELRR
ncbi:MAG: hypothetical protein H8F28_11305, partial [Fibrella sp.]|nr:hypothetical protein [Armatimonadota bacterium]